MNDNPGATPNPLNPTPVGGADRLAAPAAPARPAARATSSTVNRGPASVRPAPAVRPTPAAGPVAQATETVAAVETIETPGAVETIEVGETVVAPVSADTSTTAGAPKKKTGLIVGIIAGILVLVGGIVAAVLLLNMNKGDAVAAAMQKIMSGEAPKNVAIDGSVNILLNNQNSPIKRINIDLDSDISVGSMINTSSAVLTFTDKDDKDYSMKFDEVYSSDNNLFFKIEGATAAIEDSGILKLMGGNSLQQTNCIEDATGTTNCETPILEVDCASDSADCMTSEESTITEMNELFSNILISIIERIDGSYIRVSSEDLKLVEGGSETENSQISCITDLVTSLDKSSNSTAQLYNKYPFIKSSDQNIPIKSKQNPIYEISLDSENFTKFVGEIQNAEITSEIYTCLDLENTTKITEEDVADIVKNMPKIYAEINADNNFTRLYLESNINKGAATTTIDLGFSYPTNVNVSEPVEYSDFTTVIQTLFMDMYNIDDSTSSETE